MVAYYLAVCIKLCELLREVIKVFCDPIRQHVHEHVIYAVWEADKVQAQRNLCRSQQLQEDSLNSNFRPCREIMK